MEEIPLHSGVGPKDKIKDQRAPVHKNVSRAKSSPVALPQPPGPSEKPSNIDPVTPAKAVKRERSVLSRKKKQSTSPGQSSVGNLADDADMVTFSRVAAPGVLYNLKFQIVVLWYRHLYSQTRPRSITFVAADEEATLFEVVVSDILSEKWLPRLEEGAVYIFRRLLSSENEKRLNVIETQFQLNITADSKCKRLNNESLHNNLMLPITKLNELAAVRPRELYLRHFVVYVIDIRPPSLRVGKQGDPSRFVEAYVVDETFTKTATVLTIWDSLYEHHEDLFGNGFTKPFVLTVLGLKVRDFGGRFTLSASNFTTFYDGPGYNAAARKLHEWVTTNLHLKILERRDLLQPQRLITLSEHPEIKTIHQIKASTPRTMADNESLEFVVHGMIVDIDVHSQIHYEACDKCKRSARDRTSSSTACAFCGNSPLKVIPRFLLAMTISDSQDVMKVTAFDRDAQEILYMQVEKALEIRSQQNGYDELKKIANQALHSAYSFYLTVTSKNIQFLNRSGFKIQTIDWIPRRCITNSLTDCLVLSTADAAFVSSSSNVPEGTTSSGDSYVEIDGSSPNSEHGATSASVKGAASQA